MNGYTPEIDTPEKRAAQFEQDLPHYIQTRKNNDDCDCGACRRVIRYEQESLAAEIRIAQLLSNGTDAHYYRLQTLLDQRSEMRQMARDNFTATGIDRDGSETGISQPVIF